MSDGRLIEHEILSRQSIGEMEISKIAPMRVRIVSFVVLTDMRISDLSDKVRELASDEMNIRTVSIFPLMIPFEQIEELAKRKECGIGGIATDGD